VWRWLERLDADALAGRLVDLGLGVPAMIVAEAQRPLLFLGRDDRAKLVEDPAGLDRFLARLEARLRG
jgi:hypothetical protein